MNPSESVNWDNLSMIPANLQQLNDLLIAIEFVADVRPDLVSIPVEIIDEMIEVLSDHERSTSKGGSSR
jgi:hypothetical protein